jgi:hypothetical protein
MYFLVLTSDANDATHERLRNAVKAFVVCGTHVALLEGAKRDAALALTPEEGDHRAGHGHGWVLLSSPESGDVAEAAILAALRAAQT